MPLDEAREVLAGVSVVRRGEEREIDGICVHELDRVWLALLSLENAEEFCEHAIRLRWETDVRGRDNIAPYERYGDGILPWIATRVDRAGRLRNEPWCVLPCLLACGSEEAFGIAARVRDTGVLRRWVTRHPETGHRLLAERADEPTVGGTLRDLHRIDPRGTKARLEAAAPDRARRVLDRLGLVVPPLPDAVRAVLDSAPRLEHRAPSVPLSMVEVAECFDDGWEYPMWDNANYFCAAMRMTGFVTPGGTDGLVFQSLVTGLGEGNARVEFHRFGFGLPFGWNRVDHEVIDEETAEAIEETHTWRGRPVERHPEFPDSLGPLEVVMLSLDPGEVFPSPDRLKELLGLPAAAEPLFVLDQWSGPEEDESACEAPDLVLAVEALRERRAVRTAVRPRSAEDHLRVRMGYLGGWGVDW